jgi:hypothetical protein
MHHSKVIEVVLGMLVLAVLVGCVYFGVFIILFEVEAGGMRCFVIILL